MTPKILDNVGFVIRASGERTALLCERIVREQAPGSMTVVIRERPFNAALRKTFEAGLDMGGKWTLCIDADVILRGGAVDGLLRLAEEADEDVFEVQARVLDKLFLCPKGAGNHLYRTRLLEKALGFIPEQGVSMRPETYVIKKMAAEGHPWVEADTVVGLHDYGQFYRDIYRKAFVHANKHGRYRPYLERLWGRMAVEDRDYEVALSGFGAGQEHSGEVVLDSEFGHLDIDSELGKLGLIEKGLPGPDELGSRRAGEIIEAYRPPVEYGVYEGLVANPPVPAEMREARGGGIAGGARGAISRLLGLMGRRDRR